MIHLSNQLRNYEKKLKESLCRVFILQRNSENATQQNSLRNRIPSEV